MLEVVCLELEDESDVDDEVDELDSEDDELVEGAEPEELEEDDGFVGVADELAGVELPVVLADDDEEDSFVIPRSDASPERAELRPPCRLWKIFTSNQLACVRAMRSARIDSRRT